LHTNGYSLARGIVFDHLGLSVDAQVPALGATVADALLEPHRSYLPLMRPLLGGRVIKGMAHITGGGITDNLPRILPPGTAARVRLGSWEVPALFRFLQEAGRVPQDDALRTFNMGIGMIIVTPPDAAARVIDELAARGERGARLIGEVVRGDEATVHYD
jgi:phosphoribosylformylglycinamidine cyclo-ligase